MIYSWGSMCAGFVTGKDGTIYSFPMVSMHTLATRNILLFSEDEYLEAAVHGLFRPDEIKVHRAGTGYEIDMLLGALDFAAAIVDLSGTDAEIDRALHLIDTRRPTLCVLCIFDNEEMKETVASCGYFPFNREESVKKLAQRTFECCMATYGGMKEKIVEDNPAQAGGVLQ